MVGGPTPLPHLFVQKNGTLVDKPMLEVEWARHVAREERGGYNARQLYWPYHLYELTHNFPDDPQHAPTIAHRMAERRRAEAEFDKQLRDPRLDFEKYLNRQGNTERTLTAYHGRRAPVLATPIATPLQGGRPERSGLLFLKILPHGGAPRFGRFS